MQRIGWLPQAQAKKQLATSSSPASVTWFAVSSETNNSRLPPQRTRTQVPDAGKTSGKTDGKTSGGDAKTVWCLFFDASTNQGS